jgi:hypothetical protein
MSENNDAVQRNLSENLLILSTCKIEGIQDLSFCTFKDKKISDNAEKCNHLRLIIIRTE